MTAPSIEIRLHPEAATPGYSLACAGGRLLCDLPPHPGAAPGPRLAPRPLPGPRAWQVDYRGPGLSEGRIQAVVAASSPPLHRVHYEDGEIFVASDEGWILREPDSRGPGSVSFERSLGAPLALVLAARGRYLLHASAVGIGGRAIALVGESGAGKSTLARAATEAGFVRLADDQFPVRLGAAPAALPHFPQLKLPAESWYPDSGAAEIDLAAVVTFHHAPALAAATLSRLEGAAACLCLVRATVAARLFAAPTLDAHLAAAADASERVGVYELVFPSGEAGLSEALAALSRLA